MTSLLALFWNFPLFRNFPLMICDFSLLFSHSKNIRMSTLITIIITCWLLVINNDCSVGVMKLCLINLLILIDCFLCNSYPCVLFESLLHVINQASPIFFVKFGINVPLSFSKILKSPSLHLGNFQKVNSVNLFQISLLNMRLLVQMSKWRAHNKII